MSGAACRSVSGSVTMTKLAWYRPAASLITVMLDGAEGSVRDQRTGTSPTPGRASRPLPVIFQRAFLVNRMDCR